MQFRVLTIENQRDLLQKRIVEYEITHFQITCEQEIATVQGREEDAALCTADLEPLEKALEWCHNLYDLLNSALQAD